MFGVLFYEYEKYKPDQTAVLQSFFHHIFMNC
jgi:hypothetical protein